jgi:large subunit ribosomal protein L1
MIREKKMALKGKKYRKVSEEVDRSQKITFNEAVQLALKCAYAKFDETVDIAVRLGVDPRHADQMVRGALVLPHGLGKSVRLVVFAKGEKEKEALEAGADFAGADDLIDKIQQGWLDFDKTIATPDMMSSVSKLGRVLGPRGMMPNAKLGTVTFDVGRAVRETKAGKIEFKVEKTGIVHAPMGKVSFGTEKLMDNIRAFMDMITRMKPPASKGSYMKSIAISTTMGPGIKIDPAYTKDLFSVL